MAMRFVNDDARATSAVPQALVSAIERLAGARSQADVIETLRKTARALAGADGICIVLRDNGRCHYIEEEAIGPLWKGGKFPLETCISGWAMLNNKTVVIPDVFVDDRIPHAIYRQTFVKSLVMTPIGRDEPIAALGAYWAKNYTAPPEVVETLETLARAAATALENVHLIGALSASLRKTELARLDLRHRLKNALSAIETFGEIALPKEHARSLSARLASLARAHAMLDQSLQSDEAVALADVINAELAPFEIEAKGRIEASGSDVKISGAQAIALGLTINELISSSSRTGALAGAKGRVKVRWREESRIVMIEWHEYDAPKVKIEGVDAISPQFGAQPRQRPAQGQSAPHTERRRGHELYRIPE
jgi:two-component sensor histidine kinase